MDWKQFAKGSGMHPSFCDQTAPLPRFWILLGYAFSLLFKKAVNLLLMRAIAFCGLALSMPVHTIPATSRSLANGT